MNELGLGAMNRLSESWNTNLMSVMSLCVVCVCASAHILAGRSIFVLPMERLDISVCVREREKQRGWHGDSFISQVFQQTSIKGQRMEI